MRPGEHRQRFPESHAAATARTAYDAFRLISDGESQKTSAVSPSPISTSVVDVQGFGQWQRNQSTQSHPKERQ